MEMKMGKVLYHGTKESSGLAILKDGFIDPKGTEIKYGDKNPTLRPQQGKVYMSHSLEYATIYAIGANMIGSDSFPSDAEMEKYGRYCYIFEFDEDELKEDAIHPDEDNIGEILHNHFTSDKYKDSMNNPDFRAFVRLAEQKLTAPQLRNLKSKFCDYDWFAKAGKKLMSFLTPSMTKYLIHELGAHTAHSGKVYIKRAFKFDRKKNKMLKSDASNILELSREIKVKKPKKVNESLTFESFLLEEMKKAN